MVDGLALDRHGSVQIVLRRDTSVGFPCSTLVRRSHAQLASDWYDVVTMRANPVLIHFFMISSDRRAGFVIFIWSLCRWIGRGLSRLGGFINIDIGLANNCGID